MSEKGYIKIDDYKHLYKEIKDNMDELLKQMYAYYNGLYYDMFYMKEI